jgi:hypothetical protein
MTSELQTESVACETKQESMDVELQCNTLNDGRGQPEYDDPDLLMFLRKKKNLFEHAFLEHSTLTLSGILPTKQTFNISIGNWFGSKNSATQTNLTGSLNVKFTADQDKEDFRINKIGLNIKGMVLAVAVGASKHLGSCEHNSFVCGWNLFRSNINPNEPHWTLNLNGCVVSMAWHPRKSSIFAAGTLNGVISIFDIGKEEGNPL